MLQPGDDDSGIGGTGRAPTKPAPSTLLGDDESGIGGTGIYGTVGRSDRLCVSGIEIQVPEQLAIESSSAQAQGAAGDRLLAPGQVVFVIAKRSDDGLIAQKILIDEKYAGRIDQLAPDGKTMIVSGRRVRLGLGAVLDPVLASGQDALREGQWIDFHGMLDASPQTFPLSRTRPFARPLIPLDRPPSAVPKIRNITPPRPNHPIVRPSIPDRVKPTRPVDRPSSLDRK